MTSRFNGIWFGQNAKKHYIFCGKYSGVHGKRYQDKILGNQICCMYLTPNACFICEPYKTCRSVVPVGPVEPLTHMCFTFYYKQFG